MEENVALDSNKQKQFVKSIKGIKKLIKKNVAKSVEASQDDKGKEKTKTGKIRKRKPKRGLVYLAHIPHGFYEHEMTQYFKQFGVVTNARVIRSKRTGNSKGYAFVEFKQPSVAQIVAETMNNYLMGKRLIKSAYIPPEKQKRRVFRKRWSAKNNPGNTLRIKMKKAHNADKDELGELKRARKLLSNLSKTKKKLSELGINYDFFTPVDMPTALIKVEVEKEDNKENEVIKKEENGTKTEKKAKKNKVIAEDKKEAVKGVKDKKNAVTTVQVTQSKPGKKEKNEQAKQKQKGKKENVEQPDQKQGNKEIDDEPKQKQSKKEIVNQSKQKQLVKKENVDQSKQKQQAKKEIVDQSKQNQLAKKENVDKPKQSLQLKKEKVNKLKDDAQEIETNKKQQKKKQQDLKDKGVKPLEDFLKLQASDEESNSSYAFDSDEYEKMIDNESGSDLSSDDVSEDGYSSDEEGPDPDASSDESEDQPPPKQVQKIKSVPKLTQPMQTRKNVIKQEVQMKVTKHGKRKAPQPQKAVVAAAVAAPKKQKFEKQNNPKARNKQFKKKK